MAAAIGALCLLAAPTLWAAMPVLAGGNAVLPHGGPPLVDPPAGADVVRLDPTLVERFRAERGGRRFVAATYDIGLAARLAIDAGEPVMALGGYAGIDPILTPARLVELVRAGVVGQFLLYPSDLTAAPRALRAQPDLVVWIRQHCTPEPGPPAQVAFRPSQASAEVVSPVVRLGQCRC